NIRHPLNVFFVTQTLSKLEEYRRGMSIFEFSSVLDNIYSFFWDMFCDWILECSKALSNHISSEQYSTLLSIMQSILFMFHPFAPFITEWLHKTAGFNILLAQTKFDDLMVKQLSTSDTIADFNQLSLIIRTLRRFKLLTRKPIRFFLMPEIDYELEIIERLSGVASVFEGSNSNLPIFIPIGTRKLGIITDDFETIKIALNKALEEKSKTMERLRCLLESDFVEKAPNHVVENERRKLENLYNEVSELETQIKAMSES
ncbi:MAG: class I tRNA ligase family protein, partial [Deltaproteobacteria bacterium]|nr:class I tRNA ligase family protein [Deltaproteobacteria bacterium]